MEFANDVRARQMIMLQTLAKRQFQKINGDDEPMETPLGMVLPFTVEALWGRTLWLNLLPES